MAPENKRKDAREEVPANDKEVLISFNGLYYIGRFNAQANGFETREGNFFIINPKSPPIFWSDLPG